MLEAGPLEHCPFPDRPLYLLTDPAGVEQVLYGPYRKSPFYRDLFGDCLVTREGDDWQRCRRRLAPLLAGELEPLVRERIRRAWRDWAAGPQPVDVWDACAALSLEIACRAIGGLEGLDQTAFRESMSDWVEARYLELEGCPQPRLKGLARAVECLLPPFEGGPDELKTLLFASYETTAIAMARCLHALARGAPAADPEALLFEVLRLHPPSGTSSARPCGTTACWAAGCRPAAW